MTATTHPDRLLNIQDLTERLGMGRTTIFTKVRNGQFPQPIRFGSKCSRWKESEITAWVEAAAAARKAVPPGPRPFHLPGDVSEIGRD